MAAFRYLVDDVDRVLPFYEALGFVLAERWGPAFAIVTRGDVHLWLSGPGTSARQPLDDGTKPGPGGWNRFVIEVNDLQATLKAIHATPHSAPVSGPGGHQALVLDPSGNPVEIFQPRNA